MNRDSHVGDITHKAPEVVGSTSKNAIKANLGDLDISLTVSSLWKLF